MQKIKLPQVVLCGRTNVGKSSLFNRLSETQKALISDLAGTTRDRNSAVVEWQGKRFELIDTGGLDIFDNPELVGNIKQQIQTALKKAAVILLVLDGKHSPLPQDKIIARELSFLKKPLILVLNKMDGKKDRDHLDPDIYRLNIPNISLCSAANGNGTGDLLDEVVKYLPAMEKSNYPEDEKILKLALIGRPNVGKSSLLNALIGEERAVVSEIAHTTRDINDVDFIYKGQMMRLIDTAGIRRRSQVGQWSGKNKQFLAKIEHEGVNASLDALMKADIVILMLEAFQSFQAQDQNLLKMLEKNSKSLIIVLNKWDLVENKDAQTITKYKKFFQSKLSGLNYAPIIFTSVQKKQHIQDILELALEIKANQNRRLATATLQGILDTLMHAAPRQVQTITHGQRKKPLHIHALKQIRVNPPTFVLHTPHPMNVAKGLVNILEKKLRSQFNFRGTPIKISIEK